MKHQSQPSIQNFFNLSGDSDVATQLRDRFIFKVVPMLNPDGCIVGNTRCSLAARDLNRQYKSVIKEAFPSVFNVKTLVRRLVGSSHFQISTVSVHNAQYAYYQVEMYHCIVLTRKESLSLNRYRPLDMIYLSYDKAKTFLPGYHILNQNLQPDHSLRICISLKFCYKNKTSNIKQIFL